MRGLKEFLQSSTIHGLAYIATTENKLARLFWMFVVLSGFTVAAYMIQRSDFCTIINPLHAHQPIKVCADIRRLYAIKTEGCRSLS